METADHMAIHRRSIHAACDRERVAAKRVLSQLTLDDLFEAVYDRILLAFARVVGWVDRYFVDGILNIVSDWTVQSGDELRGIQTGRPQDYVYGVGAGVLGSPSGAPFAAHVESVAISASLSQRP